MGERRPTLADVARAAGVSATTASHALSGKGRVDSETRQRVRSVAEDLGYVASRVARNLALGRSDMIGLMLPQVAQMPMDQLLRTDWYGRVAAAASQEALKHHRALVILPPLSTAGELTAFGLDGVIVLDPLADDPRVALLRQAGTPAVMLGAAVDGPWPCVLPDTSSGMRVLLDHLWAQGARRVAIIATDVFLSTNDAALRAYLAWCASKHLDTQVEVAHVADCTSRDDILAVAQNVADRMLATEDRPDAVIGLLDELGLSILRAATSRGLRVPEDLLVAQDVDGIVAQLSSPPVTAIDLNIAEQVAVAVALLVDGAEPGELRTVPVTLVARRSTAALA